MNRKKKPGYRRELEALIVKYQLNLCVECGKCSSTCTMAELFTDFGYDISPRGNIEKALRGEDIVEGRSIWYCLTCDVCTAACPSGVKYRDFVEALRAVLTNLGVTEKEIACRRCKKYFIPEHTLEYLKARLKEQGEFLETCPLCRRYLISEKIKETLSRF